MRKDSRSESPLRTYLFTAPPSMLSPIIVLAVPSAHRSRALIAALLTGLTACIWCADAAARPSLLVAPPTTAVRPGESVELTAFTADVRSCVLELSGRTGRALRSTVVIRDPSEVRWRWRTPARARAGLWTGSVSCWTSGPPAPRPADVTRPVEVRVLGSSRARTGLVGRDGVSTLIAAAPHPEADRQPKWTEKGQFWIGLGSFVVTSLGLAGVAIAAEQLRSTRREALAERTVQMAARFHQQSWLDLWSRIGPGYLFVTDVEECFDRIRAWEEAPTAITVLDVGIDRPDKPKLSDVQYGINFNEEAAVPFNARRIDQEQMMRHFASEMVNIWQRSWWWVHWQRANKLISEKPHSPRSNETELYAEWERMVQAIVKARPALEPKLHDGMWIICLPEQPASVGDWEEHRALSARLSSPFADPTELEARLKVLEGLVEAHPDAETSRRVVCVPPWQAAREIHVRVQRVTRDLGVLLEAGGLDALEAIAEGLGAG